MTNREPARRFISHFGKWIMNSKNKHEKYTYAINDVDTWSEAQFIHLPKNELRYIGIDLDWEGSASVWIDEGFPEPTITIISPETSHSKLFYELATPVTLPFGNFAGRANLKPYHYFKSVKAGLTLAMGGDPGYSGGTMNNPFYKNPRKEILVTEDGIVERKWKVHWADRTYDLDYLAEFAKPVPRDFKHDGLFDDAGRALTMFHLTRTDAYRAVHGCVTQGQFAEKVLSIAMDHWLVLRQIAKDHPLEEREAVNVANSVTKYVWLHRNDEWLKRFKWNVGALQYYPIDKGDVPADDIKQEIARRQSAGAKHTHSVRTEKTEERIRIACEKLKSANTKVTRKSIALKTGLGVSTMSKYKDIIKEYKQ